MVKTDNELVNNIKDGKLIEDSLRELMERHSGIFYKITHRYLDKAENNYEKENILGNVELVFYNSSLRYDENKKTKFSTFIGNETRWLCLDVLNKNKKSVSMVFNEGLFNFLKTDKDEKPNPDLLENIFEIIKNHDDNRALNVFKTRYLDPKFNKLTPWRIVSKKVGLSIQGCIDLHNRILKDVKSQIKNETHSISTT